jgi:hypothetical protein
MHLYGLGVAVCDGESEPIDAVCPAIPGEQGDCMCRSWDFSCFPRAIIMVAFQPFQPERLTATGSPRPGFFQSRYQGLLQRAGEFSAFHLHKNFWKSVGQSESKSSGFRAVNATCKTSDVDSKSLFTTGKVKQAAA